MEVFFNGARHMARFPGNQKSVSTILDTPPGSVPPSRPRILYSNYRQLGFFNQFGEFSSLAKFVSGSQEVASPIRLSCQVRAALFNNK